MLDYSAHLAVSTIERVCGVLETPPPQGYEDGRADADQLKINLAKISTPDTGANLLDAVFEAVADGRHPADDENVRKLLIMSQLENYELHRVADERSRRITGDTVQRFAEDFIAAWQQATATDGEILAATAANPVFAAVPVLGEMPLTQLMDPTDHATFIKATIAARRLDAAADGFGSLLSATHLRHRPEHRVLVLAPDLGVATFDAIRRDLGSRQKADAWTLARHGVTPRLCGSLAEFVEAVGRLTAAQAHRQAEEQPKPTGFGGERRTAQVIA